VLCPLITTSNRCNLIETERGHICPDTVSPSLPRIRLVEVTSANDAFLRMSALCVEDQPKPTGYYLALAKGRIDAFSKTPVSTKMSKLLRGNASLIIAYVDWIESSALAVTLGEFSTRDTIGFWKEQPER
jgi:hypothetical protein